MEIGQKAAKNPNLHRNMSLPPRISFEPNPRRDFKRVSTPSNQDFTKPVLSEHLNSLKEMYITNFIKIRRVVTEREFVTSELYTIQEESSS